jgi:iron(III) transport system permease protein
MSQSRSATSATLLTGRGNLGVMLLTAACLAVWAVVILLPLLTLCIQALQPTAQTETAGSVAASLFRSLGLAAAIAAAAVLLGYAPGRLLGTCRARSDLLLLLLLMPLVLPRYVLYYAWTLLLSPTTQLGAYLGSRPEFARLVGALSSSLVVVSWYWPLAALLIAQGWRNIDRQILDCASIDGGRVRMFSGVTLPLLLPALCLAFAVCMVLSLSEFATFHLAGVQTIGTELAVLYQMTGSESSVARAAWPMILPALILAVLLGRNTPSWTSSAAPLDAAEAVPQRLRWCIFLALIGVSLVAPLVLLIANVTGTGQLRQFLALHLDQLVWSLLIATVAAVLVHLIALGAMLLETVVVSGPANAPGRVSGSRRILSFVVRSTILLAMFLPASLVAVGLLKMLVICKVPPVVRQGWYVVSAGQAAQFAGAALILFLLVRRSEHRQLSEMACSDGASPLTAWWYVHLPRYWPILVGSFILVLMLCMTELSATMVLLPAGVPSFAQWLLNQMHYVRDQHVIASCLMLVCLFVVLAAVFVLLMRVARLRRQVATMRPAVNADQSHPMARVSKPARAVLKAT